MNIDIVPPLLRTLAACVLACIAFVPVPAAAHGPGGDHAEPAGATGSARPALPRFEAATDAFELVAELTSGEFSILIDRFETNAPVLGARVEVEAAGRKAEAKFRADRGDYAIDDAAFLSALSAPGEHAVVVAIVAGEESDLLNGTLVVAQGGAGALAHTHDGSWFGIASARSAWIGAAAAAVALLLLLWLRRRRHRRGIALAAGGTR